MNEQQWLMCADPRAMVEFVRRLPEERIRRPEVADVYSPRKMRLLAAAVARHWVRPGNSVLANITAAEKAIEEDDTSHGLFTKDPAYLAADEMGIADPPPSVMAGWAVACRDIFNPFRPVVLPKGEPCRKCKGKGTRPAGAEWNHPLNRELVGCWTVPPNAVRPSRQPGAGASTPSLPARVPCEKCGGRGHGLPAWITPQALSLAEAAYGAMPRIGQCEKCKGSGKTAETRRSRAGLTACASCIDTGKSLTNDGTLDPFRLALLADALEEAGCVEEVPGKWRRCGRCGEVFAATNKYGGCDGPGCDEGDDSYPATKWQTHPIVAHLRSPGPHVRGCWSLDLILGKS